MTRMAWSMALVGVLAVRGPRRRPAEGSKPNEDDLAVVKRAVAPERRAPPRGRRPRRRAGAPGRGPRSDEPQWLKVRVVDKATGKKKVTVNLPLALVERAGRRLAGGLAVRRAAGIRSTLRMSEVLAALESGQDLVQVDDEDSEVRVWVE